MAGNRCKAPPSLPALIESLSAAGEVVTVSAEVDPNLEAAAISEKLLKKGDGGKSIIFNNLKGEKLPAVFNLSGSQRRLCISLGISSLDDLTGIARNYSPVARTSAPVGLIPSLDSEIYHTSNSVSEVPKIKFHVKDGESFHEGYFLTSAVTVTRAFDSDEHDVNIGVYRISRFSDRELGINLSPESRGFNNLKSWENAGKSMPAAVLLGTDPATFFAAALKLPKGYDKLFFAFALHKKNDFFVRSADIPLCVPSKAQMVIEGFIEPFKRRNEGRFANYTGSYAGCCDVPVLRVNSVRRVSDALIPFLSAARFPSENGWIGVAAAKVILPLIQQEIPEIADILTHPASVFDGCAAIVVKSGCKTDAKKLLGKIRQTCWYNDKSRLVIMDAGNIQEDMDALLSIKDCCADAGDEVFFPPELIRKIDSRWKEYGF